MNYIWLVICWVGYFIIHSVFALDQVKKLFYSMGLSVSSYRLIFNIFGLVLLIPIFIYSSSFEAEYIFPLTNFSKYSGLFLAGLGIIIIKIAFNSYDTKAFLGIGSMEKEKDFRTDGLLQHVRHPLYSGLILLLMGYFFYNPIISTGFSVGMMILYIIVGIQFEERKLIKTFGKRYIAYKKKTPMLIPKFWNRA